MTTNSPQSDVARVDPVPGSPAAVADLGAETALVVADYHAGIERSLRSEGVELPSAADERRRELLSLVAETGVDRVLFLGDLVSTIGQPSGEERTELTTLVDALPVPATLVPGNHDGEVGEAAAVEVTDADGVRYGDVAFAHGHTWPDPALLDADVLCIGHEHPQVRLEDEVGGRRVERAWLRGPLSAAPFSDHYGESLSSAAELVVFPAFNERCGGSWVNVDGQGFLAPFLPDALPAGEAYLLDGTRLGPYAEV
ncbi:MAG: metallophosphoesterase [Halobacteriaceae archaeon]